MTWAAVYGLHAPVMMAAVFIPVAINGPENECAMRAAALAGAAARLGLAEWSRRRKKLLHPPLPTDGTLNPRLSCAIL